MNQILDYNPNKSSGGGSSGSDKIIRVFAILLILFALVLLGGGAYGFLSNQKKVETPTSIATKAEISVEVGKEKVKILVNHDKVIAKMIYNWDSGKDSTIQGKGESTMEEEIPLLAGEHTLSVKVIDVDNGETTYTETIVSETGEDKVTPKIDVTIELNELVITAKDETAIDFVTYRWNEDEEVKIDEVSEDGKTIEFRIEIPKGYNDLMIVAVDKNNNTSTESQSYTGLMNPKITFTVAADKKSVEIECSHEKGLKEITFTVNGTDYDGPISEDSAKQATFTIELVDEKTELKAKAVSVDGTFVEESTVIEQDAPQVSDDIEITIEQNADDAALIDISAKCEAGLKEIKLNVNDVDYDYSFEEGNTQEGFQLQLGEGNQRITLKVISVTGNEKEEVKEFSL